MRERKSKANKFQKFLTLLNIHTNLHFTKIIRKYIIIMNLNVLVNELKHKYNISFLYDYC